MSDTGPEVEALKHDIERHLEIISSQLAMIEQLEATITELLPLATAFLVYTYEPVKTAAILERARAIVQQTPPVGTPCKFTPCLYPRCECR